MGWRYEVDFPCLGLKTPHLKVHVHCVLIYGVFMWVLVVEEIGRQEKVKGSKFMTSFMSKQSLLQQCGMVV